MLFNSYIFILTFLPIAVVVFYALGNRGWKKASILWLVACSLFFYGWWNPVYLYLIVLSILFNFVMGRQLQKNGGRRASYLRKSMLIIGIALNLSVLGYFKYANFFIANFNQLVGTDIVLGTIVLPLAISFFTFQQITFLVDSYQGITREYSFLHYCLFVVFFPQLIAGPIVHHKEMLPQFENPQIYTFSHERFSIGISYFILGLFKKVVIADGIATYSTPVFAAASAGQKLSFFEAWGGALSYTFQLYFDFSGYSDMAIGLAYLFGIKLALNFHSPYKANNIIDFWRRWHITLSRFLKEYLYIPLGGNRNGKIRRYANLFITMVLGGLWHGAGWTFVLWGVLHGLYLGLNHFWIGLNRNVINIRGAFGKYYIYLARLLTFLAVVVSWVFFRADDLPSAIEVLKGMMGMNGVILPVSYYVHLNSLFAMGDWLKVFGLQYGDAPYFRGPFQVLALAVLLWAVWFMPNVHQILHKYTPVLDTTGVLKHSSRKRWIVWEPTIIRSFILAALLILVLSKMDSTSEFLYFQF